MKAQYLNDLKRALPRLAIRENVSYRDITSLGVGSALPVLAEPQDPEELAGLLRFTSGHAIPVFVIGGGTNLVGMDAPCPMLGIRLHRNGFSEFSSENGIIRAGAHLRLPDLTSRTVELGLGGLARLAGIPGTLGGALRMNAGANGVSIGDFIVKVSGFDFRGNPWSAGHDEIEWRYRGSSIPDDVVITGAELKLPAADRETEIAALRSEVEARRKREPAGRSAGCTFRNVSEFEPAGRLIDQCRLKNYRIGGVAVSAEHANFIVNLDSGRESDYVELVRHLRCAVAEKHGFYLRPEVKFLNPDALPKVMAAVEAPKINLLLGGASNEREISLKSGSAVAQALRNGGFDVTVTDVTECRLLPEMREADVVYPVLHGGFGEDGRIQKVMEEAGLRFVGSGSAASLLTMDKIATKRLLDRLGIPTAKWSVVTRDRRELPQNLKLPLILKVPMEGSTFGIVKVERAEEWDAALEKEFAMAGELLVEEYIDGIEITVPIVNGEVLPAIEIKSPHGFYDYDAKYVYKDGHTEYFCPAHSLSAEQVADASRQAVKFYLGAGCRDILRVDFIVGKDGVPYMLEGNSIPGCTATSLVPKAAKVSGISFEKMTATLVYAAMRRHETRPEPENAAAPASPAPARLANKPNPLLVKLCHLLFRLALVLCAVPLIVSGIQAMRAGYTGWPLLVSGLFVLCAEFLFKWFDRLEKMK